MRLAMIGLGRMGANMARRLLEGGHALDVFDPECAPRKVLVERGAKDAASLAALVAAMPKPRVVWIMVPAGRITDSTLAELITVLEAGDTVVDGGNSNYKDTQRRALQFVDRQLSYIDCGTSGGVWGLTEGYSMMVGGEAAVVKQLQPIFETLADRKSTRLNSSH